MCWHVAPEADVDRERVVLNLRRLAGTHAPHGRAGVRVAECLGVAMGDVDSADDLERAAGAARARCGQHARLSTAR